MCFRILLPFEKLSKNSQQTFIERPVSEKCKNSGHNCPLTFRNCHTPQTSQPSFTILKKKCLYPKLIKWHKKQPKPLKITLLREITLCPSSSLMPKKLKIAIQPNDEFHPIFALFQYANYYLLHFPSQVFILFLVVLDQMTRNLNT